MDFERLGSRELENIGIRFETESEAHAFAQLLLEELERRVGEEIAAGMTNDQMEEFGSVLIDGEANRWLAENFPDYKSIVWEKKKELEEEVIKYRSKISGALPCRTEL